MGSSYRTRGRGTVQVLTDERGHCWVTCTGCKLDKFSAGVSPASAEARRHAAACDR